MVLSTVKKWLYIIILINLLILVLYHFNEKNSHFLNVGLFKNESLKNISFAEKPYVYEDEVDLRIIVMTHIRHKSVVKLLNSLQYLELDGDIASLEIWLDPNKKGVVDNHTLEAVSSFKWLKGPTRVYSHSSNVGIIGQWIDTWRPKNAPAFQKNYSLIANEILVASDYREICLLLEDDMTVSSQAYRWLKAVHRKYAKRTDFAGVTLYGDRVKAHNSGALLKGL